MLPHNVFLISIGMKKNIEISWNSREIQKCNFIAKKAKKAFFTIKRSSFRRPYNHLKVDPHTCPLRQFFQIFIIFSKWKIEKLVDLKKKHFFLFVSFPLKLGTHGVA